jgi:hypothetical protein
MESSPCSGGIAPLIAVGSRASAENRAAMMKLCMSVTDVKHDSSVAHTQNADYESHHTNPVKCVTIGTV